MPLQNVEVAEVVGIAEKHLPPIIPALCHVVGHARNNNPPQSSHAIEVLRTRPSSHNKVLWLQIYS